MTSTNSLTDQQLDAIDAREKAATAGPWAVSEDYSDVLSPDGDQLASYWNPNSQARNGEFIAHARTDVRLLLDEIRRLNAELAEEKASRDPRLRCLLVKAGPDRDLYVGWSNVCDMPAGAWSRETALEYGFPPSRLDRADETGTSSHIGDGAWDDKGFVAEQRGWLRRELLGDYAVEYLHGDRQAAYALLEPFEDDSVESPAP